MNKIRASQAMNLVIAVVGAVPGITKSWRNVTGDMLRVIVVEPVLYIYYIKRRISYEKSI